MNKKIRVLLSSLALILALGFTACTEEPKDSDVFVGQYQGMITYTKDGQSKTNNNGTIWVAKVGDKYNFTFSDGIPSIYDIEFDDEGSAVNLEIDPDNKDANFIRITSEKLNLAYYKDKGIWTATATRK